jgi:hypothetical protein
VENLATPDLVRRLAWTPPEPVSPETVGAGLRAGGAREWQISLVTSVLVDALSRTADDLATSTDTEQDTAADVVEDTAAPVASDETGLVR